MKFKHISIIVFCYLLQNLNIASQTTSDDEPTQSVRLVNEPNVPHDSVATADDITNIYFNPGGLGLHPLQLGYFYGENKKADIKDHTVFLNLLGLAFSTQWRFAPQGGEIVIYSLGSSLYSSKTFSIGTTYSWYTERNSEINDFNQWDIGIMYRPISGLSFGAVVRSLNSPETPKTELGLRYDLGFSIRPFALDFGIPKLRNIFRGTIFTPNFLSLSIDTTWYTFQNYRGLLPRYFVELNPIDGLSIYGGWNNFSNTFFGIKMALNPIQFSGQGNFPNIVSNDPNSRGNFFSTGFLLSKENLKSIVELSGSYLHIDLNQNFIESKKSGFLFIKENITFYDLLNAIRRAATDQKIIGILLTGRMFSGGWAQAEELRKELLTFRNRYNKKVIAHFEYMTNREYFIASAANQLSLPPVGTLLLNGLTSRSYFLKGLLDKLGIKADFIIKGNYKSAPDSLLKDSMSKYDKEQKVSIMKDLKNTLVDALRERNYLLSKSKINAMFDEGIFSSQDAKQLGLIDKVIYLNQVESQIHNETTIGLSKLSLASYINRSNYDDQWGQKPQIAILVIEGEIISGRSRNSGLFSNFSVGSDSIIAVIKQIQADSNIEGVIIRINSPGGSALASDLIWHAIRDLKKVKKQVTISLGDVAASGGYYIAMAGDQLLASENSITGSIGVFGGKLSISQLYEKLGINKVELKTNKNSTLFSEKNLFSKSERVAMEKLLSSSYNTFLQKVNQNRTSLSKEQIVKQAGGKVYTGATAKQTGMIDGIGGLLMAVELTRLKLGLNKGNFEVIILPKKESSIFNLTSTFSAMIPAAVTKLAKQINSVKSMTKEKTYFLLPQKIEIE